MWAEAAVHARQVPYDRDPYLRSGETEGRGGSQDPGVRRGATQAAESGGSVLGTKEPDWIAALAPRSPTCFGPSKGLPLKVVSYTSFRRARNGRRSLVQPDDSHRRPVCYSTVRVLSQGRDMQKRLRCCDP